MASTIRGSDNFDSAGGNAVKAWVNFNGIGTIAIRASYNVSSITDNGTGDYTVNFTTALADANYAAISMPSNNPATGSICSTSIFSTYSTTQVRIQVQLTVTGALQDPSVVALSVFR